MQIWCENGMIVVPVLQQPGMEGSYMLEVFSEIPLSLEEMPQTREKTVASSWTETLSGGMHRMRIGRETQNLLLSCLQIGPRE